MPWTDQIFKWLGHGRYKASPAAVGDGQVAEILTDSIGRARVIVDSMAAAGSYTLKPFSAPASSGVIKGSAGSLRQVIVSNGHTVGVWVVLMDAASVEAAAPEDVRIVFRVAAEDTASLTFAGDVPFSSGIVWAANTDFDLEAGAPDLLYVNALYL